LQSAEDFCLLFTAREVARGSILKLTKKFPIYKIGKAKKGSGIFLSGKKIEVKRWQHFE